MTIVAVAMMRRRMRGAVRMRRVGRFLLCGCERVGVGACSGVWLWRAAVSLSLGLLGSMVLLVLLAFPVLLAVGSGVSWVWMCPSGCTLM